MVYRFGRFEADRAAYRVTRQGDPLDLTPKLLDLLFHFLDRPGRLVTKEELLDAVWPGANVTENAMAQAISDLREALGDEAASPTYIRTIARRGYRFIADVNVAAPPAASPEPPPLAAEPGAVTVAVMDFTNLASDRDVAWLGAGIAETVTTDLASLDRFRVVDRWRVVEATRRTGGSLHEVGAAVGARLMVTGGFQRSGRHLRITARMIDLAGGEALADAKVDGLIDDVFSLQDGIVRAFARELGLSIGPAGARGGVRETTNLEAYRAYMEGWLKIESLDLGLNAPAMQDFERAIATDPRYAIAYTGLANAEFVSYEMSRATRTPNLQALRSAIEHARHAVHLDPGLAEAHATLSFLLTAALQFDDARRAAQQAVSLEPDSWRHQYRLGHALWGEARLRAFDRAAELYPQFAYLRFETAMVHVARGQFDHAMDIVQEGAGDQDRQSRSAERFPGVGFHWLLGAIRAARGDHERALVEFAREIAQADTARLYGAEYAAAAHVSRGHACLYLDRLDDAAMAFEAALSLVEGHARALLGWSTALARQGHADAARRRDEAREVIADLRRQGREIEWLHASAIEAAADGRSGEAVDALARLLDALPACFVGWTIPIDPALQVLHADAAFRALLARVADRAR